MALSAGRVVDNLTSERPEIVTIEKFVLLLASLFLLGSCQMTNSDATLSEEHRELVAAFVDNRRTATAIDPIPADSITESEAYRIADAFLVELTKTEGPVGGYKIGTFEKGIYDDGPVDGWSGPVTAIMFASGLHPSGHRVSIDCCNFTFVEADFAAEVGSDAINDAQTDLEILAALNGFRPFIEMPDILTTKPGGSKFSGVATNYDFRTGILGDLVRVPATPTDLARLNSFRYAMTNEKGEVLGEGFIAAAYEPVYRVRALRDRMLWRGRRLQVGDILSLGNMGTIRPLKPGGIMLERPRFRGAAGTVTYYDLDPRGPVSVTVHIDR